MKNPYKEKEQTPNFSLLKSYEGGKGLKYKEICEILGVEQKKGNGKKYQMRSWETYMDYNYANTLFYINEVYVFDATEKELVSDDDANYHLLAPYTDGKRLKYGDICDILGVKKLKGDSKKYQLIKWEMYMDYKYENTWFYIYEIFDEKDVARFNNDFIEYLYLWLLSEFIHSDSCCVRMSKTQIAKKSGAMSELLFKGYFDSAPLAYELKKFIFTEKTPLDVLKTADAQAKKFSQIAYKRIDSAIKYALQKMETENLIKCNRAFKLIGKDEDDNIKMLEVPLDSKEESVVLTCQRKAFNMTQNYANNEIKQNNENVSFPRLKSMEQLRYYPELKRKYEVELALEFREALKIDWDVNVVTKDYIITLCSTEQLVHACNDAIEEFQNKCRIRECSRDNVRNTKAINEYSKVWSNDLLNSFIDMFLPELKDTI